MKKLLMILTVLSFSLNACKEKFLSESPLYSSRTEKYILVKHPPKDKYEFKRLMLENWMQTLDFSLDSFRAQLGAQLYSVTYLKSSCFTRNYFKNEPEKNHRHSSYYTELFNEGAILGNIGIHKSDDNEAKLVITIRTYYNIESTSLYEESDGTWYARYKEKEEDGELAKYFMDIQKVKNSKK